MTPAEKMSRFQIPRVTTRRRKDPRHECWVCLLREKRESLRLSLQEVAEHLGVSRMRMSQIEHGDDLPLSRARRLAAFYGATVEELWPEMKSEKKKSRKKE